MYQSWPATGEPLRVPVPARNQLFQSRPEKAASLKWYSRLKVILVSLGVYEAPAASSLRKCCRESLGSTLGAPAGSVPLARPKLSASSIRLERRPPDHSA